MRGGDRSSFFEFLKLLIWYLLYYLWIFSIFFQTKFDKEVVREIIKYAIKENIGSSQYTEKMITTWSNALLESCLVALTKLQKPFKYIGKNFTVKYGHFNYCIAAKVLHFLSQNLYQMLLWYWVGLTWKKDQFV